MSVFWFCPSNEQIQHEGKILNQFVFENIFKRKILSFFIIFSKIFVLLVIVTITHAQFFDYDWLAGDYGMRKITKKLQRSTGLQNSWQQQVNSNVGYQQQSSNNAGYQQQQSNNADYQQPQQSAQSGGYQQNQQQAPSAGYQQPQPVAAAVSSSSSGYQQPAANAGYQQQSPQENKPAYGNNNVASAGANYGGSASADNNYAANGANSNSYETSSVSPDISFNK